MVNFEYKKYKVRLEFDNNKSLHADIPIYAKSEEDAEVIVMNFISFYNSLINNTICSHLMTNCSTVDINVLSDI